VKYLAMIAVLLSVSCSDSTTAPAPGNIRVTTATVGGDPDEDGYLLVVGSKRITMGPSSSVTLVDMSAAMHVLSLEGIAENCVLEGDVSRSITVQSAAVAEVLFHIACDATGVEITTLTTGADRPGGTYQVASGEKTLPVRTNDITRLSRLGPGSHKVSLSGTPANCRVVTENPVTVAVVNRALTRVTFEILCTSIDRRIAFVRDTTIGNFTSTSVLVADATGSSLVQIASGRNPAWSANGTKIVYSDAVCDDYYYYYYPCSGGLMMVDIDTRSETIVANAQTGDFPSLSPDGSSIAFIKLFDNFSRVYHLHVMPAVEGSPSLHIPTGGMAASHPSWSPDGKRIVFACFIGNPAQQPSAEICVVNRDGTGLVRLTTDAANDSDPAWSPDGSRIAFTTNRFNPTVTDVALMTPTGTGITRLIEGSDPAWLPDGLNLIFASINGLFRIQANGSGLTRLTTGRHREPAWRP